jgi:hypothetical protein
MINPSFDSRVPTCSGYKIKTETMLPHTRASIIDWHHHPFSYNRLVVLVQKSHGKSGFMQECIEKSMVHLIILFTIEVEQPTPIFSNRLAKPGQFHLLVDAKRSDCFDDACRF